MKGLIALLSITILVTACSQNTNKQEFAKAENAAPVPAVTPKQSAAGMKLTKPTELLPEITEKYSGIKIEAVNKNDNSKMEITVSMEENNPAAKVIITDNGSQVFDGWLFQEYPDMHPFEHPVWKVVLAGAVKK